MFDSLRPSKKIKSVQDGEANVFIDLDRLIAEPFGFRLHGKVHTISPIDNETFFAVTNAIAQLDVLRTKPQINVSEVIEGYSNLFKKICSTITDQDIRKMNPAQMAGLFQTIIDRITGRAFKTEEEKKSPKLKTSPPEKSTSERRH